MKTIGQVLREAREKKGLTVAQAVEGTRSKSQVIQALEQDDFSRFPAPIYTRGFIKLYAEFLGLDPAELIGLYQARNPETDKIHRPASVLRPTGSHVPAPPPIMTPDLNLPPPEPAPQAVAPANEKPPPHTAPSDTAPELPFDKSEPVPAPESPDLFSRPSAPPASLPPRRRYGTPMPPVNPAVADEFALEVKKENPSPTARDRALSLLASARSGAGRLPLLKILQWCGMARGLCLVLWLTLTVIRGCVNRHRAVPAPVSEPAFQLPPAPEPPPLYLPGTPPRS